MIRISKKNLLVSILAGLVILVVGVYLFRDAIIPHFFQATKNSLDTGVELSNLANNMDDIAVVAEELNIPWEIAFLPSGDMLVTERTGSLLRIGDNNQKYNIDGVTHTGEGGLLGLTLHPDFQVNSWLYLYLTSRTDGGLVNRVERYSYTNDTLSNRTTILTDIPGASYHDGGRIAFGPDGYLYITTGDAGNEALAQDRSSLAGKTLRVADDGSVPADSPFDSPVYSYGHRNAQGIAWDNTGNMWQTEHGRSGRLSGMDELNRIERSKNYGWPLIEGDEIDDTMKSPIAHSGADETWAPAGIAFLDGHLFFAGLRGESLYQARINDDGTVAITAHLRQDFGRLRAVTAGPDGFIYVSTSNTDGRGTERSNDDKIIRINPALLIE
jgi:glucose/arabinose dehydrogenase